MRKLVALAAAALLAPPSTPPARPEPAAAPTVLTLKRPSGPEWFGLYLAGKKAGWSRIEVARERRDGRSVLVARQETVLRAALAGREVQRSEKDEKVYQAIPGGRLVSFTSVRAGDGGDRRVELSCTPIACRAVLTAEGGAQERRLPPSADRVEQADAARLAAALRGTVTGVQFIPEELTEKKMKDVFVGRDTLAGAGVKVAVSIVEESREEDRVPARFAIADDGRVVEIRLGEALVVRAEPEEVAKRLDKVDLFNLSRVTLEGPLPRSVPATIVFRLRGLPPQFQRDEARQRYAPAGPGETAVTVEARLPEAAQPGKDAPRPARPTPDLKELLEPTPDIDSDDPAIARLAREVVGDAAGVFAASTRLVHLVYGRLQKVYGQSRDRASEVLRAGKGDCTEHELLFVALARAAGIPARGVYGLVFAEYDDGVPALYWHAWAEVKDGDEWIAVDPTFDQPVADATHIALGRLGRGTQLDAVGLLGSLAVLEAKPQPVP